MRLSTRERPNEYLCHTLCSSKLHKKTTKYIAKPITKTYKWNPKINPVYLYNFKDKNKNKKNEDDDESDDESDNDSNNTTVSNIYRIDNHIYFRADVTNQSVIILCKLIDEANSEFKTNTTKKWFGGNDKKIIYLHITSIGGDLLMGLMAVDYITNSHLPIHTIVEGYAMSAASLMSIAGKKRYMLENSYLLIHQLSSSEEGTYEKLKDEYKNNTNLMKRIIGIYHDKSNGVFKVRQIKQLLKRDRYLDLKTSMKYGLVDEIYKP